MKIIILTGKFGMGHLQAAQAVKEELEKNENYDIEIIDWIKYMAPHCAKYIYGSYASLVSHSTFFYNRHYMKSENLAPCQKPGQAFVCYLRMANLIQEKQPDLVISVLAFCSEAVSYYKSLSGSDIPLVTCVTDITGHSEWINPHTNAYAVGSQEVREFFIKKGVPEEQIFVTGIPVRQKFKGSVKNQNSRTKLLLMGGGLGMLPKKLDFYKLLDQTVPADITLITGKNKKLYQRLQGRFKSIHVYGYVENIETFFQDADLVVTKPGGITTFEAIYSETPIIALNPKLHQEKYNAEFIRRSHIGEALMIHDDYQTVMAIARFANNPSKIAYCKSHMRFMKETLETCQMNNIVSQLVQTQLLGGSIHHEIFSFNF